MSSFVCVCVHIASGKKLYHSTFQLSKKKKKIQIQNAKLFGLNPK